MEKNGKYKEYDYGKLLFEREFLNGERIGKGKEYYNDGTISFEGDYLNGKRLAGKGIDYKSNLFHEFRNKDGLIKEYHEDGFIEFEDEYLLEKGKKRKRKRI